MSLYKLIARKESFQQLYIPVDNITAHNAKIYTENNSSILIYTGRSYIFNIISAQIALLNHLNLNNLL